MKEKVEKMEKKIDELQKIINSMPHIGKTARATQAIVDKTAKAGSAISSAAKKLIPWKRLDDLDSEFDSEFTSSLDSDFEN